MCGRYILFSEKAEKRVKAIVEAVNKKYQTELKKGDIYPTDLAPVYTAQKSQQGSQLRLMHWGYRQDFGKKTLLINARSETVLEKITFREDFLSRRCLIPAIGFYEWNQQREKFYFSGSEELIYFGGIYQVDKKRRNQFLIMTKPPIELVAQVHNRMPVVIAERDASDFLYSVDAAVKIMAEDRVVLKRRAIPSEKQYSYLEVIANENGVQD